MNKTVLIVITAMIAAMAGIFAQRYFVPQEPPLPKPPPFIAPFATRLPDLSDQMQNIRQWQGKILVINFWATWCPSCLTEIPQLMHLQEQYADKNVQIIGIAIDDKGAVLQYQAKTKINYPILIANNNGLEIAKTWGNPADVIPFTIIVNERGRIVYKKIGDIQIEELLQAIQPLLDLQMVRLDHKGAKSKRHIALKS